MAKHEYYEYICFMIPLVVMRHMNKIIWKRTLILIKNALQNPVN